MPPIDEAWTELCDYILEHQITEIGRYGEAVRTAAQRRAWAITEPLLAELAAADVVLIGAPMYNFSLPSALKAWIDQVTFPRMSLAGRTFVVTGARGGAYRPGTPRERYDHHERYLRDFLEGHFDVTDLHFIHVELVNSRLDPALAERRDHRLAPRQVPVTGDLRFHPDQHRSLHRTAPEPSLPGRGMKQAAPV